MIILPVRGSLPLQGICAMILGCKLPHPFPICNDVVVNAETSYFASTRSRLRFNVDHKACFQSYLRSTSCFPCLDYIVWGRYLVDFQHRIEANINPAAPTNIPKLAVALL